MLEFTNAFADEQAKIVKASFDIELLLEIFYRLDFTENKGITTLTLTAHPVNATPEEIQVFLSINEGMKKSFGATFDQLAIYLANKIL